MAVKELTSIHTEANASARKLSMIRAAQRDLKSILMLTTLKDQLRSENPKERERANTAIQSLTHLDDCEGQEFIQL